MKNLFLDAGTGFLFMTAALGLAECLRTAIISLTTIPEPIVSLTMALVILACAAPVVVSMLSTDPSPDPLLKVLVLPPALAVAFCPLLIERAHHFAGIEFWGERLPFQVLPLYGHPLVLLGIVAALTTLPAGRVWYLNR